MVARTDDKLAVFAALTALVLSAAAIQRRRAPARARSGEAAPATPSASDHHADDGLGRNAAGPSEIPPRGWWAVLKRVANQVLDHRLMTEAAGITFFTLLSLFPALAALVSLYGLFADPATVADQISSLQGIVPGGGIEIISAQVQSLASNSNRALGFGLAISLATSLWSANQAMKALFDALNVVYDERERRGLVWRTLLSLGFTVGALLFLLIAMAAVVAVPVALSYVGLESTQELVLRLGRWPLLLVAVTVALAAIYRYGPSRETARWRWVSWGGAFAAVGWVIVSAGFSWYVESFGTYNKTYGSLGAAVGFMTWIWLSAIVVLVGGELDAELEHQTARDTTTGAEQPLGSRGAIKADHVAA
jgi:membrane protein